jgi:5-hydroxyisourate hydrolase
MTFSTHVLDISAGRPASGIRVCLFRLADGAEWREIARSTTNDDGRVVGMTNPGTDAPPGAFRLTFDVGDYFDRKGVDAFYAVITVDFLARDPLTHYHVPLLVSPYGYSTYRGS